MHRNDFSAWEPRLYYYLRRTIEDESVVSDVLQKTWLAVFRHLSCLEDLRIERLIVRILPLANRARQTRGGNWTVFIAALAVCALGTGLLVRAAFVRNPLIIAEAARHILWCPVFFLFRYPFGIATAAARLWVKFREMELQTANMEAAGSGPPTGDSSSGDSKSKPPSL